MRFVHVWWRAPRRGGEHSRAAVVVPWPRTREGPPLGAAALARAARRRHPTNASLAALCDRNCTSYCNAIPGACSHLLDKSCLSTDLSEKRAVPGPESDEWSLKHCH